MEGEQWDPIRVRVRVRVRRDLEHEHPEDRASELHRAVGLGWV